MKAALAKVAPFVRSVRWHDIFFFLGLALISYGAWLVFEPAGFIVAGLALLVMSIMDARRK